jgi:small subunit ribosomal protein S16
MLGHYDPVPDPVVLKVDMERVDYWLGVGAQPSDTVAALIKKARESAAAKG